MKKIAILPARGGSKRIPRKNIREFCGKPIIAWAIEAAHSSNCFDQIIVSTDDPNIAAVAREANAEVPFMRPAELADDYTGTTAVVRHALSTLIEQGLSPDLVCCIYATAPFLQPGDIQQGLEILAATGCDYVFSVTTFPFPIQRALKIMDNGRLGMFHPEHLLTRSQDLEEAYHDAGQFYWGRTSAWLAEKPIFGPNSCPVVLPRYRVQDIDTEEDWVRAEYMFEALKRAG